MIKGWEKKQDLNYNQNVYNDIYSWLQHQRRLKTLQQELELEYVQ